MEAFLECQRNMKRPFGILIAVLSFLPALALSGNTNVLIIPSGDHRPGAVFFVDECLTRGLTNSIIDQRSARVVNKYNQSLPGAGGQARGDAGQAKEVFSCSKG